MLVASVEANLRLAENASNDFPGYISSQEEPDKTKDEQKGAASDFEEGKGGALREISNARNTTIEIRNAAPTNIKPASVRSRRLAPRTISAPHPVQILARSGTRDWQCGHIKVGILPK